MYNRELLLRSFVCALTICFAVVSKGNCAVRDYVKDYSWSSKPIPRQLPARINKTRRGGTVNAHSKPIRVRRKRINKNWSMAKWHKNFDDMRHIRNKLDKLQRTQNLSSQSLNFLEDNLRILKEEFEFAGTLIVGLLAALFIVALPAYRNSMLAGLVNELRNQIEKTSVNEIDPSVQWLANYAKRAPHIETPTISTEAISNTATPGVPDNIHLSNEPHLNHAAETPVPHSRNCISVSDGLLECMPDRAPSQRLESAGESFPHFRDDIMNREPLEEQSNDVNSRYADTDEEDKEVTDSSATHTAPHQMRSINEILSGINLTDIPAPSKPGWLESMSWELEDVDWDMQRLFAEWNIQDPGSKDDTP